MTIATLAHQVSRSTEDVIFALHEAIGTGAVVDAFPEEINEDTIVFPSEKNEIISILA